MGIDQLALHSVQLGYLKILKMGNTDPKGTKAGKEIRGQASVRRAIKTANHATCYEMHEAIKESIIKTSVSTEKSSQVEPLYPHSISTGEIIGTTHLSASHNVALNRDINQSIWLKIHQFNTKFITPNIAISTLKAVKTAQFVPHSFNLPQQISQRHGRTQPKQTSFLLTSSTSAEAILRLKFQLPEEPKNTRFRSHENIRTNSFFALLSNVDSGLLASINRKSNSRRIQRH
ncbi:hypothetical protein F511_22915 [Dorcoceras hygrometricum]|uniref:Uncharacterized protein n=1 Tax=Dorcoceras hygrometricum TaxID=472368 RepID=A0A2Z7CQM2_9LAMI|nr:hypothetical protein F511_22915 [Dorcoceras hygrometricum]